MKQMGKKQGVAATISDMLPEILCAADIHPFVTNIVQQVVVNINILHQKAVSNRTESGVGVGFGINARKQRIGYTNMVDFKMIGQIGNADTGTVFNFLNINTVSHTIKAASRYPEVAAVFGCDTEIMLSVDDNFASVIDKNHSRIGLAVNVLQQQKIFVTGL